MQRRGQHGSLLGSMSGPNYPRRQPRVRGSIRITFGHWVLSSAVGLVLVASQSNCGFPDYAYDAAPAGAGATATSGSGGTSGTSGSHAMGGSSAVGGGGTSGYFGAGMSGVGGADGGGAGTAGEAGAPGCVYPAPVTYPAHCFDNAMGGSETGVDCGGADCVPCQLDPILALQYTSIVTDVSTIAPKFRLLLTYVGSGSTPLADIRIRYYFNHNGVTEPVIALDTQATFDPGDAQMNIANKVSWSIHRLPLGPPDSKGHKTDSYLEIQFTSSASLNAGAVVDLTQDIVAGSADTPFDQTTHYSFSKVGTLTSNNAITVYDGEQRILGVEPPLNVLPDCAFAAGVNLGGPSVVIGGHTLEASSGQTTFLGSPYSSGTSLPLPATDAATTKLLSSAFPLTSTDTATWTVSNGQYWAYAWLTTAASGDAGTLSIQDNQADQFFGVQKGTAAGWALLGPYLIQVSDGSVVLSATGKVNVAGLELFRSGW